MSGAGVRRLTAGGSVRVTRHRGVLAGALLALALGLAGCATQPGAPADSAGSTPTPAGPLKDGTPAFHADIM